MPQNKRESLIYTVMMCFLMVLWMSMYNAQCNDWIKAKENFNFVVATATENGYIAEQINNETMKAEWVIGLLWAHGMYICMLDNIIKNNKLDKEDKE